LCAAACGNGVPAGVFLALTLLLSACDFPSDAAGTLDRVEGGMLRVGVTVNAPWVAAVDGEPGGLEPDLVRQLARNLSAEIDWVQSSEATLVRLLRDREIDLLIGGLTEDSPWGSEVGFTQPYARASSGPGRPSEAHVMAVPPGESAFALALDRFLQARRGDVAAGLARSLE
jgi:polar amino acid transport system substrate-binding protein